MLLNEIPSRFNVIAHQGIKQRISHDRIFDGHLKHGTALWIHRRLPQLSGIHLAETFVTLYVNFDVLTEFLNDLVAFFLAPA